MYAYIQKYLDSFTDSSPLVFFRISFGFLMFFSLVRFWYNGWVETVYLEPIFHFKYYGFGWISSLGSWIYLLFIIALISSLFIAIGYRDLNKVREKFFKKYEKLGYEFANFIHPNVDIWDNSKVGKNNFIFENNVIQPFVKIGDNNIIWSGNHIGHHSIIGNHNFISSHVVLSGNCTLKNNIFLGVNSTIIDNSIIENNVFVDANVLIKNQTKENEFYVSEKKSPHKLTTDQLKFLK